MNEEELKQLFERSPVPEPDEFTRARHKKLALDIYREAYRQSQIDASKNFQGFDQGNGDSPRLMKTQPGISTDERLNNMNTIHYRNRKTLWFTSAAASVALVIALVVMRQAPIDSITEDSHVVAIQLPAEVPASAPSAINELDASADARGLTSSADPAPQMVAPQTVIPQTVVPQTMDLLRTEEEKVSRELIAEPFALSQAPQKLKKEMPVADASASAGRVMMSPQAPAAEMVQPVFNEQHRDRFKHMDNNPVKQVSEEPVSTFSIDVDTAAYSFVRRQLNAGVLPAVDAVRAEELINYFDYAYPGPANQKQPFATHVQVLPSPWNSGNQLVHIGIKGYELDAQQQPDSNLVFLLDVSGSMSSPDKLPLVKQSMGLLLDTLKPSDKVSIVVYAGAAGAVLEPTEVKHKGKILAALEQLQAGGSTAGGEGLALAYALAERNFNQQAVNRIILATDGDFNVGVTQDERLEDFVARKRASGIYLSVLGFGQGNYQDALMQTLAQNGNGIAAYIDTLSEAQKVLVHEATRALFPIANDVKIQVEFNPATVSEYRLIGYETRALNREDFNNDKVDAGDIGAGHTVTAIYEITPLGAASALVDASRYAASAETSAAKGLANELGFLKLRYKRPGETSSNLISTAIVQPVKREMTDADVKLQQEVNFSVAVAGFAQLLRGGQYTGTYRYEDVLQAAQTNKGDDAYGYRTEFVQLVRKAQMAKAM